MFDWLFGKKRYEKLEKDTKSAFSAVKKDMDVVGKWVKHLDDKDKQLFSLYFELKEDLSSIKDEVESLNEAFTIFNDGSKNKRLFKKLPVYDKQTAVEAVQKPVQTAVQTADFYGNLKDLSSSERLLVFTLLNSGDGMKLSYEDIAMLLGKEKSTIRGQINAIKQKSEGLILESTEKNGKKRVFIPEELKDRLSKYSKVRAKKTKDIG